MIEAKQKANKPEEIRGILNPLVEKWFFSRFKSFSLPQLYGVMEIHSRNNILISAPTGATKTLTGFLSILNELIDSSEKGILEIVYAGGDTDTTGAILGAIIGARVGKKGIPENWLKGIVEWPRTLTWMERLGKRLASRHPSPSDSVPFPALGCLPRNAFFALVVLLHGCRRLLPPY